MRSYTVTHNGAVHTLDHHFRVKEVEEKMTVKELVRLAVAGLRESADNPLAVMLADCMARRWRCPAEDTHNSVRVHIANCLACLRSFHGPVHLRTDYLLLALCQGPACPEHDADVAAAIKRLPIEE